MHACLPCLMVAVLLVPAPAHADWRAATPAAAEAAQQPRIAAVLAAIEEMDKAILTNDVDAFVAWFAADAVASNPYNRIGRKADAARNLLTDLVDYTSLERQIECAAERGSHDVVLMGGEVVTPAQSARFAGKTVRLRTTEAGGDQTGSWRAVLRQATIYHAE